MDKKLIIEVNLNSKLHLDSKMAAGSGEVMSSDIKITKINYEYFDEKSVEGVWNLEIEIISGSFSGTFHFQIYRREDGHIYIGDKKGFNINIEKINELQIELQIEFSGITDKGFSIAMDDGFDCPETIEFEIQEGKLYLGYNRNIEHGGFEFKVEINNPIEFLKSFYKQLIDIIKE